MEKQVNITSPSLNDADLDRTLKIIDFIIEGTQHVLARKNRLHARWDGPLRRLYGSDENHREKWNKKPPKERYKILMKKKWKEKIDKKLQYEKDPPLS